MSYTTKDNMQGCLLGFFLAALAAFFVVCGIQDSEGRKPNNHFGPVPEGVVQLSASAYIIEDRSISPLAICAPGSGNSTSDQIDTTTVLPRLHNALYVECGNNQSWDDHRGKSHNYGAAIKHIGTHPYWWGAVGLWFLLVNVWWIPPAFSESRNSRQEKKRKAELAKIDAETRRKELARAYSAGEIDDAEFDKGLDRVYKILGREK